MSIEFFGFTQAEREVVSRFIKFTKAPDVPLTPEDAEDFPTFGELNSAIRQASKAYDELYLIARDSDDVELINVGDIKKRLAQIIVLDIDMDEVDPDDEDSVAGISVGGYPLRSLIENVGADLTWRRKNAELHGDFFGHRGQSKGMAEFMYVDNLHVVLSLGYHMTGDASIDSDHLIRLTSGYKIAHYLPERTQKLIERRLTKS